MIISHHSGSTRIMLLCLCAVLTAVSGWAADAYVAKWGSDANDGLAWATPKLTVNAALGVATTAGSTIYVGTGTYSGSGNVDLNWAARNGVHLMGQSPTSTVFVLTGTQRCIGGLENKTTPTLFANFKIDGSAKDDGFDGSASLLFVGDAIPLNLVFSNLWLIGTYNGDQVNGIPGTTGKRNGCGIELNWYGNAAAYTGNVTVTHCLFERLGKVFYTDDDNTVNSGCYTVQFARCTFVNNNDTSSGYWEASPFTLRGSDTGKWILFQRCVMSHSAKDTTQVDRHGIRYYPTAPPVRVFCNDDLFYTNTIGTGANNCYGPTISPYAGYDTDLKTNAPVYVPFLGKSYTLQIAAGGTERGWSCTTNQNVPWIVIARTNTWVPRSTASYTLLAGTSGSLAGMMNWVNAANSQAGAIAAASSWSVATVPLALGNNVIAVSGTNADNEACSTSVTIFRDAAMPAASIAPLEIWVENHVADVTLDGTTSNVAGMIAWRNSMTGAAGGAPNTMPFVIPSITLGVGTNYLVVTTTNLYDIASVQTVTVYRTGAPTNFYVSPGGSDTTGNGSLANPWLTIAKAVSNAPNGTFMQPTLVNVAAGTYSDSYNGQWILGLVNKSYFIIAGAGPTNTLLRRGSLTLSLPIVRIDNSGFTALRGMNLDMSSETVGWADDNSAIRVTTYNLVTLEDLWLKGPVNTGQRNGQAVQVVSATATKNFVARRVLLDGFGRGGYIMNNVSTAANTILFDQCTFVNQAGTSAADDSLALWSRAGTSGTGRDGVLVRDSAIASVRKGLAVDSTTGLNALGLMLLSSYANVYSNVTTAMYNPAAIQNLNDLNADPLFTTLADTRPYVATGVYGKGWVTYSGNTVAPAAAGAGTNVPPGGSLYILTNAPVTFTGAKQSMAYLLLNDIMQNAGWTNTTWELTIGAPPAGQVVTNRLAFIGSPKSAETMLIIQQIPEPALVGLLLFGVVLLRRHRQMAG